MDDKEIILYLRHLSQVYHDLKGGSLKIAICGGAALNLLDLVKRVTKDVDVLSPVKFPPKFNEAIKITADNFGLKPDWINQGPVDLLKMGLPRGFFARGKKLQFYSNIVFILASRIDQIHFKLYASIDRGGYHVQDLLTLKPTDSELAQAAKWCFSHDVSEEFRMIMADFLEKSGWKDVAKKITG